MSLHSILVPLDGDGDNAPVLRSALVVADHFTAHVDVMHVRPDTRDVAPMFGEGMSGEMLEDMIVSAERLANEKAEAVEHLFTEIAGTAERAHWWALDGREDEIVAWRGRLSDLIVLARPGADASPGRDMSIHAALFESGRPVLLMAPAGAVFSMPKTIAVAWNGTAQSARAVQGALAFLTRAEQVHVLTCESTRTQVTAADELADYLKRWGVSAHVRAFPPGNAGVGRAILEQAQDCGAELLVSGAYSHARLMQTVLGGVTATLLDDADMPLLLSH